METTVGNNDLPHNSCRNVANKENRLLLVSLWHGLFFPSTQLTTTQRSLNVHQSSFSSKEETDKKGGTSMDGKGVLRLLEKAGYHGARRALLQLEKILALELEKVNKLPLVSAKRTRSSTEEKTDIGREGQTSVDFDETHKFTSSWQQYFCTCAAEYMLTKDSSPLVFPLQGEGESASDLTPLHTVLQAASNMHLQCQQQHPLLSDECLDNFSEWFLQIARLIVNKEESSARVNEEAGPAEAFPCLFELTPIEEGAVASMKTPGSAAAGAIGQEQQWLHRVFYTSMLYGALCLSSSYTAVRPLAVLLTAYIYQDCPVMKQRLSSIALSATVTTTCAGDFDSDRSSALTLIRLRGVIAGVLEFALRFYNADAIAVRRALECLMGEATSDAEVTVALEGIFPEPGKAPGVLQSAVLLLVQVIQQIAEWAAARGAVVEDAGKKKGGPPPSAADAAPVGAAREVVHAVQELLFTVVLGAGTRGMPQRPSPNLPRDAKGRTLGKGPAGIGAAAAWQLTTRRGLRLGEADALVEGLFPTLLQQLGWEWPWSELWRQCCQLDRAGRAPSSSSLWVAWGGRQLIETVLLRAGPRTYPARLQQVLPGSLLRVLDALEEGGPQGGLDGPHHKEEEGGEEGGAGPGSPRASASSRMVFSMPPYYAEAGETVVEYLQLAGLSGTRVSEAERILFQATSTLPLIVRLRALAPPRPGVDSDRKGKRKGEGEGNTDQQADEMPGHHRYLLTAERVAELEARYRTEVLLASVVVYTQLHVPSQVLGLMRTLAPLFNKLISLCCRKYPSFTSYLIIPSSTNNTSLFHTSESDRTDSSSTTLAFGLTFSKEVEHLINDVGYQFYPLEWMPAVATALHDSTSPTSSNGSNASRWIASSALPYSMFAAVAHQLNVNLNVELGSSGGPSQRLPFGVSDELLMPSFMTARGSGTARTDSILNSKISNQSASGVAHWRRAELFLQVLLVDCFLCCRSSSCELEGTMAVAATRQVNTLPGGAVTDHENALLRAGTNLQPGILEALWTQKPIGTPPAGKEETIRKAVGSGDRNNGGTNSLHKRTRQEEGQASTPLLTRADRDAMETLVDVLLNYGAASFETTIESKDIILVLMQAFLPITASTKDGGGKNNTSSKVPAERVSAQLLRQASAWAQEMVGSQADHSRVRMLLRQRLQNPHTSLPASSRHSRQIHSVYHAVYNSCTWDACSPARRIFRQIPPRILEKAKLRRTLVGNLTKWRDTCLQVRPNAEASLDLGTSSTIKEYGTQHTAAPIDPLLRYHWLQWVAILDKLGWKTQGNDAESTHGSTADHAEVPALSVAQWLWYSPYFTQSL